MSMRFAFIYVLYPSASHKLVLFPLCPRKTPLGSCDGHWGLTFRARRKSRGGKFCDGRRPVSHRDDGHNTSIARSPLPPSPFQPGCCELSYRYHPQVPGRLLTIQISYFIGFEGFSCAVAVTRGWFALGAALPWVLCSPRLCHNFTPSFTGVWQLPGRAAPTLERSKRFFRGPKWKINYSILCSALFRFCLGLPSLPDLLLMKLRPVYVNILFRAFAAILGGKKKKKKCHFVKPSKHQALF